MKKINVVLGWLLLCVMSNGAVASQGGGGVIGNGGDAITIGDAVRVFDEVEFGESLIPDSTSDAWPLIDEMLKTLTQKLPATGTLLRSMFRPGVNMWWLVHATLQEIPDEGPTSVVIAYQKEQVAINLNGVIQIRKDLWDQMDAESKAVLLVHEALWSAIGAENVADGSPIRRTSTLLLRQPIDSMPTEALGRKLLEGIGSEAARSNFYRTIDRDLAQWNQPSNFKVQEYRDNVTRQLLATVNASGSPAQGLQITTLNPNSALGFLYRSSRRPYRFLSTNLSPELSVSPKSLCAPLTYAGERDWRLPTEAELFELHRLGILTLESPYLQTVPDDTTTGSLHFWFHLSPRDLLMLSEESVILNMTRYATEIPDSYIGNQFFTYVCVRS